MVQLRKRTRARECALQILYILDINAAEPDPDMLSNFFASQHIEENEVRDFAEKIVEGYFDHKEEISEKLFPLIKNWTEERLTVIDRNILRMASYELSYEEDIPFKVTINEAVELGKKFSTKESGKFVNGILDEYANRYVIEE